MQPGTSANDRGQYGNDRAAQKNGSSLGGILIGVGIAVGIYAFSPGARHWYKHGHLPSVR
jgi:hypothetical protein